ncbi:hypothetical protein BaRGS_00031948, partial [Batillaria attramentaria]
MFCKIWMHYALAFLMILTSLGEAVVITSSVKMAELAAAEERWLETLRTRVPTGPIRAFVEQRSKELHPLPEGQNFETATHPNGAYLMIKAFLNNWYSIIESHPGLIMLSDRERALLPSQDDMQGALSAIVRLQRVFSLSANEMYAGNYSGHVGPTLQPMDAYEVGKRGFSDGEPELSVEWLKLVVEKGGPRSGLGSGLDISALSSAGKPAADVLTKQDKAAVMGLLGRAYLYAGQTNTASELYRESMSLDPSAGDVQKLGHELMAPPTAFTVTPDIVNTSILCSREKGHAVVGRSPPLPQMSLQTGLLTRGMVESYGEKKEEVSTVRTSDLAWIKDSQLHTAARLSKRVEDITWLNTDQRAPEGSDSGETYQSPTSGSGLMATRSVVHVDPVHTQNSVSLNASFTKHVTREDDMMFCKIWLHYALAFLMILTSLGEAVVITSSVKMAELAAAEERWLETLRTRLPTGPIRAFVEQRSKELHPLPEGQNFETATHPNGAYLMIKAFLNNWYSIIESHSGLIMLSDRERALLPSQDDMQGALSAIVRLQRVFSLSANEMYAGNYSGHVGPTLQPMDAYEVGKRGFSDGEPQLSVEWLKLVLEKGGPRSGLGSGLDVSALTSIGKLAADGLTSQDKASVMGLMGRAYLYAGQTSMASELYRESMSLDPSAGDVQKLGHELMAPPTAFTVTPDIVNTSILCSREKGHAVAEVRPYHRCRYKRSWWIPYVTYKEEILSLSPYASVFYDVIYDTEIEEFKQFLTRCMVESYGDKKEEVSTGRTSDLAWIKDSQLHTAARLSKRVEDITWLNTDQRAPEGSDSGENYQMIQFTIRFHHLALLLIVLTSHVMAEVITSSAKMAELAAIEERWLETLRTR